ncbi:hypothetical protein EYF80_004339 [Liparis tanakae]|uniref:Uncharacterized protein n=1 Tax=Liparis tanakae TaxID=230148 RepID=A0A4Z2J5N1_9TELE|nr:hypothetical protein EYF80_004339 [Liparis tanakae]
MKFGETDVNPLRGMYRLNPKTRYSVQFSSFKDADESIALQAVKPKTKSRKKLQSQEMTI